MHSLLQLEYLQITYEARKGIYLNDVCENVTEPAGIL